MRNLDLGAKTFNPIPASFAGDNKARSPSEVWDALIDDERRRSPFLDQDGYEEEDSFLKENLQKINKIAGSFQSNAAEQALKELNSNIERLQLKSVCEFDAKAFRGYMTVIYSSITKLSEAGQPIPLLLRVVEEVKELTSSQNPVVFKDSIISIEGIVRELDKKEQPTSPLQHTSPFDCFRLFRRSSGNAVLPGIKSAAIQKS